MTTRLALGHLDSITTAAKPAYDRSSLRAGIVHFGVGNFHRAHQAVYLDALFNTGRDQDWAQDWVMAKAPDQSRPANHPIHRRPHWGHRARRAAVVALAQSRPVGVVAR